MKGNASISNEEYKSQAMAVYDGCIIAVARLPHDMAARTMSTANYLKDKCHDTRSIEDYIASEKISALTILDRQQFIEYCEKLNS